MPARSHGETNSLAYYSWLCMKQRCLNPKDPRYKDYGGRGIKVDLRWMGFINFRADMGPRPQGTSLDRFPNKDGNYEPGNCRWATPKQQQRNMRTNRLIEYRGEKLTVMEWAERFGIPRDTLRARIERGWDLDDAMTRRVDYGHLLQNEKRSRKSSETK